ncbi:MAG: CoA pyrophosphatase [Chlorobi bacterium]|nr:CoA pyrophosphatase [Chlorobiota bacterium]
MNKEQLQNLKANLPENPGILGKDEFFNSAVLVPLFLVGGEFHLFFEKRAISIRQGGEICFPGGEVENSDADCIETAIRETEEEIGVSREDIKIIGRMDTLIGPRGIIVEPIVAELNITDIDNCVTDKTEVEKIFSVPVKYFEENEPKVYKVVSRINYQMFNEKGEEESLIPNDSKEKSYTENVRKVLAYKVNGETIWGITARLVYELVKRIS